MGSSVTVGTQVLLSSVNPSTQALTTHCPDMHETDEVPVMALQSWPCLWPGRGKAQAPPGGRSAFARN
jgi:hypothetical protein